MRAGTTKMSVRKPITAIPTAIRVVPRRISISDLYIHLVERPTSSLPSFHHRSDERPCGEARHKSRRNSQYRVSLDALSRVIQEFFSSIAATLCGTPHYTQSVLY